MAAAPALTSTSSIPTTTSSTLSQHLANVKEIVERLEEHHVTDAEAHATAAECSRVLDSVREYCREHVREKEILRTQLDELTLSRTLEEERTSRRLEEGATAVRAELCREILEMLQGEFACSICSEVRRT
jgi:methylthioribose-1-phosphate isomerase